MLSVLLGLSCAACAAMPSGSSSAPQEAAAPVEVSSSAAAEVGAGAGEGDEARGGGERRVRAELALARDEALEQLSFEAPEQLVFCRWYAEPERGDYLWVRLASNPDEDGDAGPRLDIDLCRVSARSSGRYAPMPAGQHGSHCAAEPGFAVWWHEGEAAVNSGPAPDPSSCELELEFDAEAQRATGSFRCAGLSEAKHAQDPAPSDEESAGNDSASEDRVMPAAVTGSFACDVVRVLPRK